MRCDGDSEKHVHHKAVWVTFLLLCAIASGAAASASDTLWVIPAASLVLCAWSWFGRTMSEGHMRVAVVLLFTGVCYADALGAAVWRRSWPIFVIGLDVLLVVEAPRYLTLGLAAAVLAWVFVVELEYSYRSLGLFDIPPSDTYAYRYAMCDCEKPPCPGHYAPTRFINKLAPPVTTFVIDFLLTRGFADQLLTEKSKMAAAVEAAEYLAGRLADFDLEAAAFYLDEQSDLPDEMAESFGMLLANLETYRPYLPTELFRTPAKRGSRDAVCDLSDPVPGLADRQVALVFTDIRSSTALWEHSIGSAMEEALKMEETVMRMALSMNKGYEVKTIGDAFMVSFPDATSAVRFGHASQSALGTMEWPEGLSRPNADDGFRMLSVRMGIHCGEAVVQQNAVTGRYDYFGPTVNRAARVEPFGAPGAVTVTAEVVAAVGGEAVLVDVEGFVVLPYAGERSGKGLKTPLVLTALVPSGVAAKIEASVRELVGVSAAMPSDVLSDASVPSKDDFSGTMSVASVASMWSHRAPRRGVFCAAVAENACVGVVRFASFDLDTASRISDLDARISEVTDTEHRLQALQTAVDITGGHTTSVVGGTAWISWGLHTPCTQGVNESSRCMLLLRQALPGERPFRAGLVTGPVATVELAASSGGRRFVTLLGACVELSAALCSAAGSVGASVLAAAVSEGSGSDDRHGTLPEARRVEDWGGGGAWGVAVYELDLVALGDGHNGSLSLHYSPAASARTSPRRRQSDSLLSV